MSDMDWTNIAYTSYSGTTDQPTHYYTYNGYSGFAVRVDRQGYEELTNAYRNYYSVINWNTLRYSPILNKNIRVL